MRPTAKSHDVRLVEDTSRRASAFPIFVRVIAVGIVHLNLDARNSELSGVGRLICLGQLFGVDSFDLLLNDLLSR